MSRLTLENGIWKVADDLSFSSVSMQSIDPTSWSEQDTDSILQSVGYSNGTTTFTMNSSTGSSNYQLNSATKAFPRMYTTLTAEDGTIMTTDDTFVFYVRLRQFSAFSGGRAFIAICADAANDNTATMKPFGFFCYQPSNIGGGMWDYTATEQQSNVDFDANNGLAIFTPTKPVGMWSYITNVGGTMLTRNDRNINQTYTTGQNLQLMVGVATESGATTIALNDTVSLDFEYQVFRFSF